MEVSHSEGIAVQEQFILTALRSWPSSVLIPNPLLIKDLISLCILQAELLLGLYR